MNYDLDEITITGHGLVNRVIHDLHKKMVQTVHVSIPNIHTRAKPYCLQTFQNLDLICCIVRSHLLLFQNLSTLLKTQSQIS